MGRLPRPQPDPDGVLTFHAVNRGNNRADVFGDDGDREAYLEALSKAKERYPFRLFGYCLMSNHVHLVISPGPGESISRIMQSVTVAHTWRHHRRYESSGHVWQGRFKSPAIESGDHLLTVLAYVEANPLRAKLVANAVDFPWSSHAGRVGVNANPLLDALPEWPELGVDERSRRRAWRKKVAAVPESETLKAIREASTNGRPFGDAEWAAATAAKLGLPGAPRPRGRPRKSAEN